MINRYGLAVSRRLGASFDLIGRIVSDTYDYQGASRRRDGARTVQGTLGYFLDGATRVGIRVRHLRRGSATPRWRYAGLEVGLVFDYGL